MTGTVTIYRTRFLEDDVVDGDYPRDDTETETHAGLTAHEAADLLTREGLSFDATGSDWAADPDGSYISNYAAAERVETSGHLSGFPARVHDAIMTVVG